MKHEEKKLLAAAEAYQALLTAHRAAYGWATYADDKPAYYKTVDSLYDTAKQIEPELIRLAQAINSADSKDDLPDPLGIYNHDIIDANQALIIADSVKGKEE